MVERLEECGELEWAGGTAIEKLTAAVMPQSEARRVWSSSPGPQHCGWGIWAQWES